MEFCKGGQRRKCASSPGAAKEKEDANGRDRARVPADYEGAG